MQQISGSSFPQTKSASRRDRTGFWVAASLMFFIVIGFLTGLVILAIRNAYLFT